MAIYCYTTEDGHTHERHFKLGTAPPHIITLAGKAKRDLQAENVGIPGKGWPLTCCASGVNAADAGKLRKCLADAGVPTEVTPDGDPVYLSAVHRRKALKARGLFDKASYC